MRKNRAAAAVGLRLTHLDGRGRVRMVDVAGKEVTTRTALARAIVRMRPATLREILTGRVPKGDVGATARIAAIQAVKRTPELIPLCHPIRVAGVAVELTPRPPARLEVCVHVTAVDRTGAEMEALTGAAVAGLTIYDMCKAIDRGIVIEKVELLEKTGGRSGVYSKRANEQRANEQMSKRAKS